MQQMRDHARYAVEFANGCSRQELEADRYFEFALTHAVELVGEAGRRVP
jgi:uncharacterized protein with HEPN domain